MTLALHIRPYVDCEQSTIPTPGFGFFFLLVKERPQSRGSVTQSSDLIGQGIALHGFSLRNARKERAG